MNCPADGTYLVSDGISLFYCATCDCLWKYAHPDGMPCDLYDGERLHLPLKEVPIPKPSTSVDIPPMKGKSNADK